MRIDLKLTGALALVLSVSCAANGDGIAPIYVADNDLGVARLQVERFEQGGEPIFELRGLDADGSEVASLRRHVGFVADLPDDTHLGTEITISVRDEITRVTTRNVQLLQLDSIGRPMMDKFLGLAEVSATVEHEAGLSYVPSSSGEGEYTAPGPCSASQLRPTPLAKGCCLDKAKTTFENPSHQTVTRQGNGLGYVCKTANGGSCSDGACFYGPCGFAAGVTYRNGSLLPRIYGYVAPPPALITACLVEWSSSPGPDDFGDVTGTCPYNGCVNGTPVTNSNSQYWQNDD